MPNKTSAYFHEFLNMLPSRMPALVLRGRLLLLMILCLAAVANAQTQTDTAAIRNDSVNEEPGIIVLSPQGKHKLADSADVYLSTDTNTHDVSALISSGYVMDTQELRHIPPAKIRALKNDDAFAYANDPAYWQKEKPKDLNNISFALWWRVFLIVCGAFLVYGIYRLSKENFSGLFQRRPRSNAAGEAAATEEELLSVNELEKRLSAAVAAGDFRTAVRLLYLKLIKTLEERQMAPANRLSTNREWASVFSDPAQAGQFRALSGAYEYVFYGGFEPNEQQFISLRQRFSDFAQKLPA